MKRTAALLIALAFLLVLPAFAEEATHTIEEYGITVIIPEGYSLLSPDMDADDPILDVYGLGIEDVQLMFEMMPLYMDAVKTDGTGEITVTVQNSDLPDYRDLDPAVLKMIAEEMTKEFGSMGVEVTALDCCASAQTAFVRLYFKSAPTMDCGVQYYTVYDGKSYSFALHSFSDTLPETEDRIMKNFMENVCFDSMAEWPPAEAGSFDAF